MQSHMHNDDLHPRQRQRQRQMTAYPIKLPDVHATGALAIWRHAGVFVLGRRRGRVV
jgi:hypothetical protein